MTINHDVWGRSMPSFVAFREGKVLTGDEAKHQVGLAGMARAPPWTSEDGAIQRMVLPKARCHVLRKQLQAGVATNASCVGAGRGARRACFSCSGVCTTSDSFPGGASAPHVMAGTTGLCIPQVVCLRGKPEGAKAPPYGMEPGTAAEPSQRASAQHQEGSFWLKPSCASWLLAQVSRNAPNTLYHSKRLLALPHDAGMLQTLAARWPARFTPHAHELAVFEGVLQ